MMGRASNGEEMVQRAPVNKFGRAMTKLTGAVNHQLEGCDAVDLVD